MKKNILLQRHSVRIYKSETIPLSIRHEIENKIKEVNIDGNINIYSVYDEPEAFGKSQLAHYGKFSNVNNYFCLVADKNNKSEELLGYYGEKLVLFCQTLGLNTCWVGLTYKKNRIPFPIPYNMKLYAVIAFGYGENQGIPHKSKSPEIIAPNIKTAPDWFRRGVEYALLAPTALNQQKFRFKFISDNQVEAKKGIGFFTRMDLGIAKYHFECGASPVKVKWI